MIIGAMMPEAERLAHTLPTDRLTAAGRLVPELRAVSRRIPNARNALTVVAAWAQVVAIIGTAIWIDQWWAWLVAVVLMGRSFALLAILAHEAGHRLLFTDKRLNDTVRRWLLAYPPLAPYDLYRRSHMAHHRDEMG